VAGSPDESDDVGGRVDLPVHALERVRAVTLGAQALGEILELLEIR
jgi:hypothetical protein